MFTAVYSSDAQERAGGVWCRDLLARLVVNHRKRERETFLECLTSDFAVFNVTSAEALRPYDVYNSLHTYFPGYFDAAQAHALYYAGLDAAVVSRCPSLPHRLSARTSNVVCLCDRPRVCQSLVGQLRCLCW